MIGLQQDLTNSKEYLEALEKEHKLLCSLQTVKEYQWDAILVWKKLKEVEIERLQRMQQNVEMPANANGSTTTEADSPSPLQKLELASENEIIGHLRVLEGKADVLLQELSFFQKEPCKSNTDKSRTDVPQMQASDNNHKGTQTEEFQGERINVNGTSQENPVLVSYLASNNP